ncbi:uncharacterized protein BJX67DRAFT_232929 [Aspergillus lucknowensis]|uniref:DUF7729 domain-containing protein n=1 Tax=Aspergillus lucknowensis TaxID=176173 RepID=A0ABR4LHB4_9EURO
MQLQPWTSRSTLLRTLVLLTSALPAVLAGEKTADSAALSRPGPDQLIAGIVPVEEAPPVALKINAPIARIHHHGRAHEHQAEDGDNGLLVPRSSSSSSPFPTTFDTSLSNNFTSDTCGDFFNTFLADSTFTNCHAISTLLRDSSSFFHILSSAASTSHVLDIACSADVKSCASAMSNFASDLLDDGNCGQDYADGNPLVTNAYVNMITYEPIYRATCLQSPDTTDYCFVDALTNTSNPVDYDVYLLPYGSIINSKPFPTCNACLQATLDIFSQWAQVDGQPLTDSYLPSAREINGHCGSDFANVSITAGQKDERPSDTSMKLSVSLPFWASLPVGVGILLCI